MLAEFHKLVVLFLKILNTPVFGLSWVVLGLIVVIATMAIPYNGSKSALIVKTVGFTVAAIFVIPGLVAFGISL